MIIAALERKREIMENTFMTELKKINNFTRTENGAVARKSTLSKVYDMFAFGGAYRNRSDEDKILLFKEALEEDETLALRCLFYLRDCREGQGERNFFRICYKWLCKTFPEIARRNIDLIHEYGRWDDLIYSTFETPCFNDAVNIIRTQLAIDLASRTPSLLGKWMPSENASSEKTKRIANELRVKLNLSHRNYRKTLSLLRKRINIVERLMSENRWDEIEFDKIPSRAGHLYKNAFARRDILREKYRAFVDDENTKVNADTLYPYEVVQSAIKAQFLNPNAPERKVIEKYWNNLPNYFENNGNVSNIMCVVDTSASMRLLRGKTVAPIDVAISLGMYCAERSKDPFHNYYISFSRFPKLIHITGTDFVDKVMRIYKENLCENTNIQGVFELLKRISLTSGVEKEDIPETIVIISDMQMDHISYNNFDTKTDMELIREDWEFAGLKMPKLVYWNVNAKKDTILDSGDDVTFVSGFSPVIFEQVISGKTGKALMLDKLNSERYSNIK